MGRIEEGLSETTVGAQSLNPLGHVTLFRSFLLVTEMVQEVICQEAQGEGKEKTI